MSYIPPNARMHSSTDSACSTPIIGEGFLHTSEMQNLGLIDTASTLEPHPDRQPDTVNTTSEPFCKPIFDFLTTALQWIVLIFTGGFVNLFPKNTPEGELASSTQSIGDSQGENPGQVSEAAAEDTPETKSAVELIESFAARINLASNGISLDLDKDLSELGGQQIDIETFFERTRNRLQQPQFKDNNAKDVLFLSLIKCVRGAVEFQEENDEKLVPLANVIFKKLIPETELELERLLMNTDPTERYVKAICTLIRHIDDEDFFSNSTGGYNGSEHVDLSGSEQVSADEDNPNIQAANELIEFFDARLNRVAAQGISQSLDTDLKDLGSNMSGQQIGIETFLERARDRFRWPRVNNKNAEDAHFLSFIKMIRNAVEPLEENDEKLRPLANAIFKKLIPETDMEEYRILGMDPSESYIKGICILIRHMTDEDFFSNSIGEIDGSEQSSAEAAEDAHSIKPANRLIEFFDSHTELLKTDGIFVTASNEK